MDRMRISKKDRQKLIETLNTALMLYVPTENRKSFAEFIADKLDVDFKSHFIAAVLNEDA